MSVLFLFIYHWLTDYFVLILAKESLFPYVKKSRIAAGAFLWMLSYFIWRRMEMICGPPLSACLAAIMFSFPLLFSFPIKSMSCLWKTIKTVFLYTFMLGGIAYLMKRSLPDTINSYGMPQWFLCLAMAVMVCFIKRMLKERKKEQSKAKETYEVEISRKGKRMKATGLFDSGNFLYSAIAGGGICVLEKKDAEKLLNEQEKALLFAMTCQKTISESLKIRGICLGIYGIRYASIGNEKGWMPGILVDSVIVKKEEKTWIKRKGMVGIVEKSLSKDGEFSVLLPADIFSDKE